MTAIKDITRPDPALVERLRTVGTAKLSSVISRMGISNIFIEGPNCRSPGVCIAGPALTLQFMPKREDIFGEDEYHNPEAQLHRHVLYMTKPGDFVVVDARANMRSGVFGEMMMTYFKGRGGIGMVIDGCLRDYPAVKELGLGLWLRGLTPNFHTQTDLMPFAVNVPVACGGVLVMPGDIIVADDDGAIAVPAKLAPELADRGAVWHEWEPYSKIRLLEGGDLQRYYPLHADAVPEFEEWKRKQAESVGES